MEWKKFEAKELEEDQRKFDKKNFNMTKDITVSHKTWPYVKMIKEIKIV